jgi:hypothetical protein
MKPTEAAALLTIAAAYDNRKPDADQAKAWAMALDGMRFEDCRTVIVEHYRRTRDWLMPSDVVAGVKSIRDRRIREFGPLPAPDGELESGEYARQIRETIRRIADGELAPPPPLTAIEGHAERIAELGHIGQEIPRD